MKPFQVLEAQEDLRTRLSDPKSPLVGAIRSQFSQAYMQDLVSQADNAVGDTIAGNAALHLRMAEAYRVTEDMCSMLLYAASKLDSSDRMDKDLPPTPFGMVRFEMGLPIREARGRLMVAHWLTWGPVTRRVENAFGQTIEAPGLMLTWWNDTRLPDQVHQELSREEQANMLRLAGPWGFVGVEVIRHNSPLGKDITPLDDEDRAALISQGVVHPSDVTNTLRYAHALWLLLNQTVVETAEEYVPRAAAKRVGRMKIPGRVSVVQLRRKAHRRSEGESHVEWAHRWLVRGHWRWQPYGDGHVERIWINGYVKGPEDKPFKQTAKVYNLAR